LSLAPLKIAVATGLSSLAYENNGMRAAGDSLHI
jgi:hypothetical protein